MNVLKKLLTTSSPTTAAEIAKAMDAARAERAATASELAALADRRADALVSSTDAAVDRIEVEVTATARKLDRLDATIARLEVRHAEAEKAETAAEIEAQATGAQKAVDQLADIYARIDGATADLQRFFAEAAPLAARIESWNQVGHRIGRPHISYTRLDVIKQRTAGAIR